MNIKLLIAEDSIVSTAIMETQIHRREPEMAVRTCTTLQCTRRELLQFEPDLLILDLGLPDSKAPEDTLAAIPELKKLRPACRIMATTADIQITEAIALAAGADEFMPKIFGGNATTLIERIRTAASR